MIWINEKTYARVFGVENKGKHAEVSLSTSKKDQKNEGKYINSSWGFVRFVGKAFDKIKDVESSRTGVSVIITKGAFSREKYTDKDGKEVYPKSPQFVVFDFDFKDGKPESSTHAPASAGNLDEDFPPMPEDEY